MFRHGGEQDTKRARRRISRATTRSRTSATLVRRLAFCGWGSRLWQRKRWSARLTFKHARPRDGLTARGWGDRARKRFRHSVQTGACSRETPKSDATWLLNTGYGGIFTGWLSTNTRVCSAGDEVVAVTTVAVKLGWFAGVGVALAEKVAYSAANPFSGIWIESVWDWIFCWSTSIKSLRRP